MWTLGIQDLQGNWKAVLVKYALHATFLHSDNFLVSADYPGFLRTYLSRTKPDAVFLFPQGTSGNQSPRYFRSGKTFAEAEAEKLKEEWQAIKASGAAERDVWNAELLFLGAEDTLSLVLLKEQGKLTAVEENLPAEVQVIGIGDTRIVGLPGEIFVEYGLTIQYRSPFSKCFVIEMANGVLPGYAATAQAYAQGGYETGASMLTGRSGEQMAEAAVQLLYETWERAES